jgi:hypothetical protein
VKWYLDGILISSDYLTAPSPDSAHGGMIGARSGFGGFQPRAGSAEHRGGETPPSATHGHFPGHGDAVRRAAEHEERP